MSAPKTRSQHDLILAERCLTQVEAAGKDVGDVYGGLCHFFPVLILTSGLAQAVAFSLAKAKREENAREKAHGLLLRHVGQILQLPESSTPRDVVRHVQAGSVLEYVAATRRVLAAMLYFKRFAVSVLKVDDSEAAKEDGHGR